jgi:hypothetical protein
MPFIYKITSPHTDKMYIGSTRRDLHTRFLQHKRDGNHTRSREIICLGDAVIECLEEVDITLVKERERFHIELQREKCVNYQIPLRTQKDWRDENKDYLYQYHHNLYVDNKTEINARNKKNYYENRDRYLERQRAKWNEVKESMNEKKRLQYQNIKVIECECGSKCKKKNYKTHLKSNKHQKYLENI